MPVVLRQIWYSTAPETAFQLSTGLPFVLSLPVTLGAAGLPFAVSCTAVLRALLSPEALTAFTL